MAGRFEDAAREYEKIGMKDKAEETLNKAKETPKQVFTLKEAVDQLNQRGQILTYYCCHCGTPLKLDPMRDILKSCPKCKYDLSAIDIAKLINQHL